MNDINVEELLSSYEDYGDGWKSVTEKVEKGILIPIKSSGSNGMHPPLYQRYRRKSAAKKNTDSLLESLRQEVFPPLSIAYYQKHLIQYEKDRWMIFALQDWLFENPEIPEPVSMNERSFEIFHREKVLASSGNRLLKNLKIGWERLAVYETCEPLSSYSASRLPGPVLIVENLDPFVSIRKLLMEGQKTICSMPVSTVVYGDGKNIVRTFRYLLEFGAPEAKASLEQLYYWGDLDWEGMQIYISLCQRWPNQTFHLFLPGYLAMIEKSSSFSDLPTMKEGQKENWECAFLDLLDSDTREKLAAILEKREYIPQEILNAEDYRKEIPDV